MKFDFDLKKPSLPMPESITLSFFQCIRDREPKQGAIKWEVLLDTFSHHIERTIKDGPAFSPAVFLPQAMRTARGVSGMSALVGDFHGVPFESIATGLKGIKYLFYSTFLHSKADPHFRVLIPFSRQVTVREYGRLWDTVNGKYFGNRCEKFTRQCHRAYYMPACRPNAEHFFSTGDGEYLSPDRPQDIEFLKLVQELVFLKKE